MLARGCSCPSLDKKGLMPNNVPFVVDLILLTRMDSISESPFCLQKTARALDILQA